jgi:hypothetical protein
MLPATASRKVKPGVGIVGVLSSAIAYFPVCRVPGTTTCQPSWSRISEMWEGSTKMFIRLPSKTVWTVSGARSVSE